MRLLTFNAWGMPFASKDVDFRIGKQAEYLREHGKQLDVVFLQEVWTDAYVALLSAAAAEAGLPYSTTYDGGVLGAGLMLLSRHPVADVAFRPYAVRGQPGALQGEALAGKGIGYARIVLPGGNSAHLFNTHTHANWDHATRPGPPGCPGPAVEVPTDAFAPFRLAHMVEAVGFMRPMVAAAEAAGELVFAGGDWNVPAASLEASLLVEMLPALADAWAAAGHGPADHAGDTCGAPDNIYTGSIIGGYVPERIDYIWTNARVVSCETTLKTIPGSNLNYSDHYGVVATVSCEAASRPASPGRPVVRAVAVAADTRDGPVAEAKVLPLDGDTAGCKLLSGGCVSDRSGGGCSAGGGGRREQLLGLTLAALRGGAACSAVRQRRHARSLAACGLLAAAAAGLVLYGILGGGRAEHAAVKACACFSVFLLAVAPAYAAYTLAVWAMDKATERSFGQAVRTVEVWLRSSTEGEAGAGAAAIKGRDLRVG